jgi:hypothetical protein
MFAPKLARSQAKAAEYSIHMPPIPRSKPAARSLTGGAIGNAPLLQRSMRDRLALPLGQVGGLRPASLVQRQPAPQAGSSKWTNAEIKAIQAELARLGLYAGAPNGALKVETTTALTESYGGDGWTPLAAATVLGQLKAAKSVATGKIGQHRFRWGEMFKDGLLDMVLGLGFDEGKAHVQGKKNLEGALAEHKFRKDPGATVATRLYQQAKRAIGPSLFGDYFVREKALGYSPPVNPTGEKRWIHAVVRLVHSADGTAGGKAAAAFKEGMATSDIAYYSGHGRYGSGPDFDRDFRKFELLDDKLKVTKTFTDYDSLKDELTAEGAAAGRDAWQQFLWRADRKRIRVTAPNSGNLVLNPKNEQAWKFGSKLTFWNLARKSAGSPRATGAKGALASPAGAQARNYHIYVFDGCSTKNYVKPIHATPGLGTLQADVLGSTTSLDWGVEGKTLAAFLAGILGQLSAEETVTNMDKEQGKPPGAYQGYGLGDNPVMK